ncbi:hypothetical protein P3T73_13725 [Kiritimatiellota bacterium B12222]|nr:hypothetical protein P3T73_13725 [Kiritimatiellota bacterium B12222]
MKTTIDLPESFYHRVKVTAAQRKISIKEMVMRGLEYELAHPEAEVVVKENPVAMKFLQGIQAENTEPVQPLTRDEIYED